MYHGGTRELSVTSFAWMSGDTDFKIEFSMPKRC